MKNFEVPILLLVYNRHDLAKKVINQIKIIKPLKIYIHADGPKNKVDKIKCLETRKIINSINWKCDIKLKFQKKNLGCTPSTIKAIDWCFRSEKKIIILEDDCVPNASFFKFCDIMLKKYESDERIMGISGSVLKEYDNIKESYFFSRIASNWGLALWKRSWKKFDKNFIGLEDFYKNQYFLNLFKKKFIMDYWFEKFTASKNSKNKIGWDYGLVYSVLKNFGLFIYPKKNLVSNIGFIGLHQSSNNGELLNKKTYSLKKIKHPKYLIPNYNYEDFEFKLHIKLYYGKIKRFKKFIKLFLPSKILNYKKKFIL